jgi:DtxR family transcriptional regulator, Mn-dependent transcriptional regulator
MSQKWELSSSLEDYLEAILELQEKNSVARVKDIADTLDVKRSSVTIALRALSEKGMVNYSPYSVITLTADGMEVAQSITKRHHLLKTIFTDLLDVNAEDAEAAACKMEHGTNQPVFRKLKAFWQLVKENPELMATLKIGITENYSTQERAEEDESEPLIDLNGCKPGDTGVIRKIVGNSVAKKRYIEMGLTMGQEVKVVKAAPLDDPIEIKVRNYRLSLRRAEAENILVEKA